MRVLKVQTYDGHFFYTNDWDATRLTTLVARANREHGGVQAMEDLEMTPEQYQAIPATVQAAALFA